MDDAARLAWARHGYEAGRIDTLRLVAIGAGCAAEVWWNIHRWAGGYQQSSANGRACTYESIRDGAIDALRDLGVEVPA